MTPTVLVVPCYNEARRLQLDPFLTFCRNNAAVSFVFVNDGSTDETNQILNRLHLAMPNKIQVLNLRSNVGKAEAVRFGLLHALEVGNIEPEFFGYWDADLATPLAELPRFWNQLRNDPKLHAVLGARIQLLGRTIERNPVRHYIGRIFATIAANCLGYSVYDTQCGAKLFRNHPFVKQAIEKPFRSSWVFDVELLARLRKTHLETLGNDGRQSLYELPLREWRDQPGSKVKLQDGFSALLDLMEIGWRFRWRDSLARKLAPSNKTPPATIKQTSKLRS